MLFTLIFPRRLTVLILFLLLVISACSQPTPPPQSTQPPLPTAVSEDDEETAEPTEADEPTLEVIEADASPEAETPAPESQAEAIDALISFVTEESPGAAISVIKDGQVVDQRSYGLADIEQRR